MLVAAAVAGAVVIYGLSGWAAWWANRKIELSQEMPRLTRASIRFLVVVVVFAAVSFVLAAPVRIIYYAL
jgi:hypothetical protein